jgi:uncharacterized protein (DUF486 family)
LPTTRDRGFDETATSENALPSQEWIRTYSKELQTEMRTILLLTTSNIFMTIAWYGHLKLWKGLQVPANRIGSYEFSTAQLKTTQEVITLTVFSLFSVLYLGDKFKWNYAAGFACIVAGSFFIFTSGRRSHSRSHHLSWRPHDDILPARKMQDRQ